RLRTALGGVGRRKLVCAVLEALFVAVVGIGIALIDDLAEGHALVLDLAALARLVTELGLARRCVPALALALGFCSGVDQRRAATPEHAHNHHADPQDLWNSNHDPTIRARREGFLADEDQSAAGPLSATLAGRCPGKWSSDELDGRAGRSSGPRGSASGIA